MDDARGDSGPRPAELLVVAQAGCTAMDVVSILRKKRQPFTRYQVRVIGLAPAAAGFAGFSRSKVIWLTMLLSGGLAGLAGLFEVAGPIGQLVPRVSPGYGFTAIIVAFLGRLNPLGIIAAGLFLALTYVGGEAVQLTLSVSDKVTRVFQGLLLFFVLSCDTLILYKIRLVFPGRAVPAAQQGAE